MIRRGQKVRIEDGRIGTIVDINKRLGCYQVMFDEGYGEMIPFDKVEKVKKKKEKVMG